MYDLFSGADTAPNLMGRISLRKGWLGRGPGRQRAAGENFFEDRLGYPTNSMKFKTESFTYVMLLIFAHFVINITFNFLMIG